MRWLILIFCLSVLPSVGAGAQALDTRIADARKIITCPEPDEMNPVTINAVLVDAGDSMAVIIKARLAPGWHIYAYVPETMPYIVTEYILRPDSNVTMPGSWDKTTPTASAMDIGVLHYEKEAVFIHKLVRKVKGSKGTIDTGLYYQTCDLRQCLPPVEKSIELKY